MIVQFKKGRAFPFLSESMNQLTNIVVDAELVLQDDILNIREGLLEAPTAEEKFKLLEAELLKGYLSKLSINSFVDFAALKIISAPDQSSIKDISAKSGYSQKHLITLFKEHVGVTPKEFLKVIRFQKAIQEIERQAVVNWSSMALDCGFYDQSHFIADFKTYSGFTPAEYLRQRGQFLNFIPVH